MYQYPKKKKRKTIYKIRDKVIYLFYNSSKDESRRWTTYFASSGCAMIFTPNDFKIGQVTAKETTTLAEYIKDEKRIVVSTRYRHLIALDKNVSQNIWDEDNLLKYNYSTHKSLCKKFKIRYKKPKWHY